MGKSKPELVHLPQPLWEIVERARLQLGMSRSGFFKYCILRTLEDMSLLSTELKKRLQQEVVAHG